MTPAQQLWAAIVAGLVLVIGPLFGLLVVAIQYGRAVLKAKTEALTKDVAKSAAYAAEEQGVDEGLSGKEMAKIAEAIVAKKLPGLQPAEVAMAVRAAVGEAPSLGATGDKRDVTDAKPIAVALSATVKEIP